jgi:acetyl esterase/lipase
MLRPSAILFAAVTLINALLAHAATFPPEVKLWPGPAPGSEGDTTPEASTQPDPAKLPTKITYVNQPTLTVFLPPKEKATGTGIVIAPGGGHAFETFDNEGWQLAEWLNQHGVAAFVLKYRLARTPNSRYTVLDHAFPDSARAIRTLRARAKEWNLDPSHIGFLGFSAGGELAALVETRFDNGNHSAADPIDRASSRPDFTAIIYPGFRAGAITVPKDAPPAFLVCANDDASHVVTTAQLYMDLQKAGISAEMHIYAGGGHGFGIRETHKPSATWPARFMDWIADRKL